MSRSGITDELFEATADMPPSTRINLRQVHVDGRRIRRRRRIVRSTVACAVVAGLVAGGTTAFGAVGNPFGEQSTRHSPATQVSTSPAPPRPTPPADATAPGRLDPRWVRIKTGWLPDALKQPRAFQQVETAVGSQDVRISTGSVAVEQIDVHLYAAGSFDLLLTDTTPGPDINGQKSRWRAGSAGSGSATGTSDENIGSLWWQWAPDAWAEISIHGAFGGPAKDVATNIANGLVLDQAEPVKLPFAMPKLPAGFNVVRTEVMMLSDGRSHVLVVVSGRPLGGQPEANGEQQSSKGILINVGIDPAGPSLGSTRCRSLESLTYETEGKWDDSEVGAATECVLGNTSISVRATKDLVPTFPKADHLAMFNAIEKGMSSKPTELSTWTAMQD